MTENEAIEALRLINTSRVHPFYNWEEMAEVRDIAISALKEIQQYRKIGTVEECRKAAEKQKPKQAEHSKWIGINGALYDLCPTCGTNLCTDSFLGEQKENYCGNCGQKLDWSEEE